MDSAAPKKKRGRPVILVTCPICHKQKPTKEFNRLKTACKGCQICFTSYLRPDRPRLGRPPRRGVMSVEEFAPILRSIEATEQLERDWAAFAAAHLSPKCDCCGRSERDIGELDDGTKLCELCWWDVRHTGECIRHSPHLGYRVFLPEKVGGARVELPPELQAKYYPPVVPGPPLTPEQIAADGENEP